MSRRASIALLLALVTPVTVVGCGGDEPAGATAESATTVPTEPNPSETAPTPARIDDDVDAPGRVTGDAPAAIVDDIVRQVSDETGLDPGEISVDVAIAKVWTDGSLGCAEPGFVYTQQQAAGYQIELSADGRAWSYRVRENGEVVTCEE